MTSAATLGPKSTGTSNFLDYVESLNRLKHDLHPITILFTHMLFFSTEPGYHKQHGLGWPGMNYLMTKLSIDV